MNKIKLPEINYKGVADKIVWVFILGIMIKGFGIYNTVKYIQPNINKDLMDSIECMKKLIPKEQSNEEVLEALDTMAFNINNGFITIDDKLQAHDKTLIYILDKVPTIDEITKEYLKSDLKSVIIYDTPYEIITDTFMTQEEMFN